MNESKVISIVEKCLFVKFGLLAMLVFSLTLAAPAGQLVKAGAHKICQATVMNDSNCPTT